ncbi:nucleotide pyrophosphohydrolase [Ectobacillus antri]|uniref:Nucleotide pyrophosphohydrolase n=1 Tax=Ectobacillus antri TaxID=2486280 RepID=A0ABT6H5L8_9BACI|nr:nucleotide pyrophosphohydrolase [Ectobacillus antri]MDG4657303.1 nucleotide pyrophosphohydrolase [Ectobacillus antri]MDG5754345.1 nucleotide pyrophosphohydrolase [Ectobacillus antri]
MKELIKEIRKFRDERGWGPYHNEKDLAISISLEANELLENFQWISSEEALDASSENIKEEMADVFIYLLQLADKMDVDLIEEAFKKMDKNALKYPVNREK